MAYSKQDYYNMGGSEFKAGRACIPPAHLKAYSWQYKGWVMGWRAEQVEYAKRVEKANVGTHTGRITASTPNLQALPMTSPEAKRVKAAFSQGYAGIHARALEEGRAKVVGIMALRRQEAFAKWPGAAAEHLRQLSIAVAESNDVVRMERLMRSITRLVKRHGKSERKTTGAC